MILLRFLLLFVLYNVTYGTKDPTNSIPQSDVKFGTRTHVAISKEVGTFRVVAANATAVQVFTNNFTIQQVSSVASIAVDISHDGSRVAITDGNTISILDYNMGWGPTCSIALSAYDSSLTMSGNGEVVAYINGGAMTIHSVANPVPHYESASRLHVAIALSRDGNRCVGVERSGNVSLHTKDTGNMYSRESLWTIPQVRSDVDVAISRDGKVIVIVSEAIHIFQNQSGTWTNFTFNRTEESPMGATVSVSNNGSYIAVSSFDIVNLYKWPLGDATLRLEDNFDALNFSIGAALLDGDAENLILGETSFNPEEGLLVHYTLAPEPPTQTPTLNPTASPPTAPPSTTSPPTTPPADTQECTSSVGGQIGTCMDGVVVINETVTTNSTSTIDEIIIIIGDIVIGTESVINIAPTLFGKNGSVVQVNGQATFDGTLVITGTSKELDGRVTVFSFDQSEGKFESIKVNLTDDECKEIEAKPDYTAKSLIVTFDTKDICSNDSNLVPILSGVLIAVLICLVVIAVLVVLFVPAVKHRVLPYRSKKHYRKSRSKKNKVHVVEQPMD
mmetsp:Transcript_137/g.145  ORF Transcript_137/g.145 Transcript_137/m.145 type:complete len:560 (-) Transcript_137:77-1756(-)